MNSTVESCTLALIKNANVFAPEPLGYLNLLIGGGKVLYMGKDLPTMSDCVDVTEIDLQGKTLVPGFIDGHAHICGGGGETGFSSRVPPVPLSDFTKAGVTTVVGLLGTDDLSRSTESLVSQVYGLREEGLSAYCYTGGYHLPPTTLTGSIKSDIVYIEPVLGIGELAISDHRSSQPTLNELLKVAAEAHVARLMTNKAGVVHLHLGDGKRGLSLVREALEQSEIPARTFNPTHVNRKKALFEEACELTKQGVYIDITAFEAGDDGVEPDEAIIRYIQSDYPQDKLTISSDGGGCLPDFNCHGELIKLDFGKSSAMTDVYRKLINAGYSHEVVLPFFTTNVASLLQLENKGKIKVGMDADLVIFNQDLSISHVMALGNWHIFDTQLCRKGLFE